MESLTQLQALGLGMPSPPYLFGAILFGVFGFAMYRFGKKTERNALKWNGVALMLFPYVISETWLLYLIGVSLCLAAYFAFKK